MASIPLQQICISQLSIFPIILLNISLVSFCVSSEHCQWFCPVPIGRAAFWRGVLILDSRDMLSHVRVFKNRSPLFVPTGQIIKARHTVPGLGMGKEFRPEGTAHAWAGLLSRDA